MEMCWLSLVVGGVLRVCSPQTLVFSGGVAFTVAFFSPLCCSLRLLAVVEVMKFGWSETVLLLGAQTAFSLGEAALEVGFMSGLLVLYELSVKRV